jgi:ABC-type Fe3+ transport system permease subunit
MAGAIQPLAAPDGGARWLPRGGWVGYAPPLTLALFLVPIGAGLLGTWLPAFGYLPALGGERLTLDPWRQLLAQPGLAGALTVTVTSGVLAPLIAFALTVLFAAACHETRLFAAINRLLLAASCCAWSRPGRAGMRCRRTWRWSRIPTAWR